MLGKATSEGAGEEGAGHPARLPAAGRKARREGKQGFVPASARALGKASGKVAPEKVVACRRESGAKAGKARGRLHFPFPVAGMPASDKA